MAKVSQVDLFFDSGRELLSEAMKSIRAAQQTGGHTAEIKADDTEVTPTDLLSERIVRGKVKKIIPDVLIRGEELGATAGNFRYQVLIDPLDGTKQFKSGMSGSTVIIALYDLVKRKVVACHIGEPCLERMWSAAIGHTTRRQIIGLTGVVEVTVWRGEVTSSSLIFIDISSGFRADGGKRKILSDEQACRLYCQVSRNVCNNVVYSWSNGLQQAMVANGEEGVAGAITTAIGGPYDVAGVLLILKAGGAAKGLKWDACLQKPIAGAVDPLAVSDYNLLVAGNCVETVEKLETALIEACS